MSADLSLDGKRLSHLVTTAYSLPVVGGEIALVHRVEQVRRTHDLTVRGPSGAIIGQTVGASWEEALGVYHGREKVLVVSVHGGLSHVVMA